MGTLFLQNADIYSEETTFEDSKIELYVWCLLGTFQYKGHFLKKCEYLANVPFFQIWEHAIFTKIDPFSAKFRKMMRTFILTT